MITRSRLDGKRIIKVGELFYKVTETDHLGFYEVLETIPSLEHFKAFEKMVINSNYGAMHIDTTLKTFNL